MPFPLFRVLSLGGFALCYLGLVSALVYALINVMCAVFLAVYASDTLILFLWESWLSFSLHATTLAWILLGCVCVALVAADVLFVWLLVHFFYGIHCLLVETGLNVGGNSFFPAWFPIPSSVSATTFFFTPLQGILPSPPSSPSSRPPRKPVTPLCMAPAA